MVSSRPSADAIRVSPFVLTWPRLLGLQLSDVARVAGLSLDHLKSAKELTYEETLAIWGALETLTNDPVVGLRAGMRFTVDQMGVVGPALAHATHLDAALDVLGRVMSSFARNTGIRRVDSDAGAGLEYTMPTLRARHGVDTIFAATVALMRECTGSCGPREQLGRGPLVPLALEHQMPPMQPEAYLRFFGVTPSWNAPSSRLWFARADLGLPFRGASPALARLLVEEAPRLLTPPTASRDEGLDAAFWRADARGEATLDSTAEALGVSARTLQRRLRERNTTFAAVRARLLEERAVELLHDQELPVETIAERLGYTSRAAFERAFLRWTGRTPAAIRAGA
jgi:AraC-like DNA-binding protein